ncbi:MAG: N-acetyltransferase [Aquabacterium sp.]|nr:MAG: N-acetyltransferase [Aquabacterium sp.]
MEHLNPSDTDLGRFGVEPEPPPESRARPWHRWVPIRKLGERHRRRIERHLLQLGPEDRRLRFGVATTNDQIRLYVHSLDFERDELFGVFDRRLHLVAVAHLAYSASPQRADRPAIVEFGVSVLERARRRGLGDRLFSHAVLRARNRHTDSLFIHALTENGAMLKIAARNGALLEYSGPDAMAWLRLPSDTVSTHVGAALVGTAAELNYGIARQLRLLTTWFKRVVARRPTPSA